MRVWLAPAGQLIAVRGKRMKIFRFAPLLFVFAFLNPGPKTSADPRAPQDPNSSSGASKVVYVSDFELDVVPRRARRNMPAGSAAAIAPSEPSDSALTAPRPASSSAPGDPSSKTSPSPSTSKVADPDADDGPSNRAAALLSAMSINLVRILEKAGYTVRRVHGGEAPPHTGLRIRGVFAETDEQNRIRRLLVGGDSTTPKMLLYVGVDNLARPEQPLYELAKPPSSDGKHGPVITVTSYSPVARFEMDKNAADDDIKKIATEIVADLNALVNSNPTLASQ
jgi:hypothetical protein